MVDNERRAHHRFRLWIPARIEGEDRPSRLAVGHDMSQKGSLLVTRSKLHAGERVRLFLRIPPHGDVEQQIAARVLRTEENSADPEGLWPYRVAVEFDQPYPEVEELLREHSEYIEGVAESGRQGDDAPPDDEG
jgi:hypothetical protein